MDARNGHIVKVVHGVGGSDEGWFNKGDDRYYLAARNNVNEQGKVVPALGNIDARTKELLGAIPTGTPVNPATSAHSVAADVLERRRRRGIRLFSGSPGGGSPGLPGPTKFTLANLKTEGSLPTGLTTHDKPACEPGGHGLDIHRDET